jgi:hypothetical protein
MRERAILTFLIIDGVMQAPSSRVAVGAGKRLFSHGTVPTNFRLVKTDTCSTGATMSIYRRAPTAYDQMSECC